MKNSFTLRRYITLLREAIVFLCHQNEQIQITIDWPYIIHILHMNLVRYILLRSEKKTNAFLLKFYRLAVADEKWNGKQML